MTSSGCLEGGPFKNRNGKNPTGGSTIVRLLWWQSILYLLGFGALPEVPNVEILKLL